MWNVGELCKGEKLSISVIRGPELDQRPSFGCRLLEISTSENMVQRIMSISIKESGNIILTYGYVLVYCVLYYICTSPSLLADIKGSLLTAILRLRMLRYCDWDNTTYDRDF